MAKRPDPIARIRLDRSAGRLLILPILFVVAGAARAAYGVLTQGLPVAGVVAAVGAALVLIGLGWAAWVLSPDMKLPGAMRLKESRRVPMWNGPIECRLFRFDLVAGSARVSGSRD